MWKIQLFKLNFDEREKNAASDVVEGGWLAMGERILDFESSFSNFLGNKVQCVATSSGTASLHMSLLALDIGSEDEVIIPALTFVADANVVRMVGARPVLADCESLANWNVSANSIEKCITPQTKAVIVVHYAGYPCDMPAIVALCKKHGIYLIEDAAHAPGASIEGKRCGTWGDIGCFSFFSNKNLSVGEGGMVSTQNEDLYQRLRYLRSHGMTSLTLDRHKGRAVSYDIAEIGLNYRMDEIRAALGLVQLDKLPSGNALRENLTARYRANLKGSSVTIPFDAMSHDSISAYHILPVLLPKEVDRLKIIESLKNNGIQSSIHYPPFWGFTAYKDCFDPSDTPIAADICDQELTLPLFPTLTIDEVDSVTTALQEALT